MNNVIRIVTASWTTDLPSEFCRIGVSRGLPRRQRGYRTYPILAPGPWMWASTKSEFIERYGRQLAALDPIKVATDLATISGGRPVGLLCFERPFVGDGFCHRALIAAWLADGLGIAVPEFGSEDREQCKHPMLPPRA